MSNVDIQFCETDTSPDTNEKESSHIAFLSDKPHNDLLKIAEWFKERGFNAIVDSWTDKEFYIDVPEIFIDFAIEAMLPELAEYDK